MDINAVYEKNCILRTLDFDCCGNLKPSALLDIFQLIAQEHTVKFACDKENMSLRGLYWVLVGVRIDYARIKFKGNSVVVRTWPLKSNNVKYYRNFSVAAEDGSLIATARSCWAVLSSESKKIVTNANAYPEGFLYCEDELGGRLQKLSDFTAGNAVSFFEPLITDIDYNKHMNNAKYADYALNAIWAGDERAISSFAISYRKEILLGEKIEIISESAGDLYRLKGVDRHNETRFIAEIETIKTQVTL